MFNRTRSVSPLGALLSQSKTSIDIEKKNHLLYQHCYRELNALSKRELELIRSKELKKKMRKANIYFTRMKKRESKDTDSVLSRPLRESITPSRESVIYMLCYYYFMKEVTPSAEASSRFSL